MFFNNFDMSIFSNISMSKGIVFPKYATNFFFYQSTTPNVLSRTRKFRRQKCSILLGIIFSFDMIVLPNIHISYYFPHQTTLICSVFLLAIYIMLHTCDSSVKNKKNNKMRKIWKYVELLGTFPNIWNFPA